MNRSVTIDGHNIELTPFDNNIIEMISRANIKIPAPCYRSKRIKGCCSVCVVEIDGEQKLSCSTILQHGMNIIVGREDLKTIRKQRLLDTKKALKAINNEVICAKFTWQGENLLA